MEKSLNLCAKWLESAPNCFRERAFTVLPTAWSFVSSSKAVANGYRQKQNCEVADLLPGTLHDSSYVPHQNHFKWPVITAVKIRWKIRVFLNLSCFVYLCLAINAYGNDESHSKSLGRIWQLPFYGRFLFSANNFIKITIRSCHCTFC